jgi:hypothetical protein
MNRDPFLPELSDKQGWASWHTENDRLRSQFTVGDPVRVKYWGHGGGKIRGTGSRIDGNIFLVRIRQAPKDWRWQIGKNVSCSNLRAVTKLPTRRRKAP